MIESSLRSILTASKPLSSMVGERIYPLVFPQGYPKPAIIYEKISDPDEGSHRTLLIQYVVHSAKYTEAETVIGLVWDAFKDFDGGVKGRYKIHAIEQTGQIAQSSDPTVPLIERSEIFRVFYTEV